MSTLDTNNNGSIDYTEFLAGCLRSKIYLKEEVLKTAFEYFDQVRLLTPNTTPYRTTAEPLLKKN